MTPPMVVLASCAREAAAGRRGLVIGGVGAEDRHEQAYRLEVGDRQDNPFPLLFPETMRGLGRQGGRTRLWQGDGFTNGP